MITVKGSLSGQEVELDDDVYGKLADYYLRLAPAQLRDVRFIERVTGQIQVIRKLNRLEQKAADELIEQRMKEVEPDPLVATRAEDTEELKEFEKGIEVTAGEWEDV